jgi:nitrogen fixation protein FixH
MSAVRFIPKRIEGRHVLIALFAFFGVTFLVNGIFLYFAVGTFNGFETTDAYRRGLTYNERIAADTAQAVLGWQPVVRYEGGKQQLIVEVPDAQGRRLAGLTILGEVRRPVTDIEDRDVTLRESAPARYSVPLKLAAGQWVLSARIFEHGASGKVAFRFKQRFWVKESP